MAKLKTIIVAGVKLNPDRFPNLYRVAQRNPEGLEAQLRSLNKASGGDSANLFPDAINLEMDLQHG